MGLLTGACLGVAAGLSIWLGAIVGAIGALAGTFGGYNARVGLVRGLHVPDIAVGVPEDLVAVGTRTFSGFSVLKRFQSSYLCDSSDTGGVRSWTLRSNTMPSLSARGRQERRSVTALAEAGMRTALIERKHVGGTCINEGCTPTKTMVASGRVAYLARRGRRLWRAHRPNQLSTWRKSGSVSAPSWTAFATAASRASKRPRTWNLIFGEARFTGPKTVAVRLNDGTTRSLSAEYFFINAGTRAGQAQTGWPGSRRQSRQYLHHGTRHGSRAPVDAGRRLYWAGVRATLPALWQPGDDCAVRRATARCAKTRTSRRKSQKSCGRTESRSC